MFGRRRFAFFLFIFVFFAKDSGNAFAGTFAGQQTTYAGAEVGNGVVAADKVAVLFDDHTVIKVDQIVFGQIYAAVGGNFGVLGYDFDVVVDFDPFHFQSPLRVFSKS